MEQMGVQCGEDDSRHDWELLLAPKTDPWIGDSDEGGQSLKIALLRARLRIGCVGEKMDAHHLVVVS